MNIQQQQRPRFRTDLVAQSLDQAGQRFVDVTDPDSGQTFRFYEVEYSIACAMDGQRDLEGLVLWARTELGLEPTHDELQTVISTLDDLGYLERAASGAAAASPPPTPAASGDEASFEGLMEDDPVAASPSGSSGADKELVMEFEAPTPPPAEVPVPRLRPQTKADSDEDGPTQLPKPQPHDFDDEEVSVDLSEHLSLGADDVKEAVRQSKVMQAVEPPAELTDPPDDPDKTPAPTTAEEVAKAKAAVPESPAIEEAVEQEAAKQPPVSAAASAAKGKEPAGAAPIALPDRRAKPKAAVAVATDPAPAPPEPRSSASTIILLLVLILAVGGAAAYYYFEYIRDGEPSATASPGQQERQNEQPPPPPMAVLAAAEPEQVPLEASSDGEVAWLEEDGAEVEEGAVVVKMGGYEEHEKQFTHMTSREAVYQNRLSSAEAKLEKAQADGDEKDIKRYGKAVEDARSKVAEKQRFAAEAQIEMENYFLKTPAAGIVRRSVEDGASVEEGAVILVIEQPADTAGTTATFSGVTGAHAPGDRVTVEPRSGGAAVACKVSEVAGDRVTVRCPADGHEPGSEVVLK